MDLHVRRRGVGMAASAGLMLLWLSGNGTQARSAAQVLAHPAAVAQPAALLLAPAVRPRVPTRPVRAVTAVPPPPSAAAPAGARSTRDRLWSDGGAVDAAVGVYGDCTGATAVPAWGAMIDSCVPGRLYFLGHTPGVFSGLGRLSAGSRITWWDDAGVAHVFRVTDVEVRSRSIGAALTAAPGVVAQFQTCENGSGTLMRVVDAVPA
jgi:hypothetical protein